ncbi:MAG: hypothetical protein WD448_08040 [Woeseia sp.]
MPFALAGVIAGTGGVALLYFSWSGRLQRRAPVLVLAWTLVALSFWLWPRAVGVEFGTVMASLQLSLAAWVLIIANPHVRRSRGRRQEPATTNLPRLQAMAWHAARFLLAVPLAAVASTAMVLAAVSLLPWADVDRLALAVLAVPLVWGLVVYWALLDWQLLRPALGIVAGGALGMTVLYL